MKRLFVVPLVLAVIIYGWSIGNNSPAGIINWQGQNGVLTKDIGENNSIIPVNNLTFSYQMIETRFISNAVAQYGGVPVSWQDSNIWTNALAYPSAGPFYVIEKVNGITTGTTYIFNGIREFTWYVLKIISDSGSKLMNVYLNDIYMFTHSSISALASGMSGLNIGNVGGNLDDSMVTGISSVQEPSTMLLLGSGLIGLVGLGRTRMRK